jgi:hypothetical protein
MGELIDPMGQRYPTDARGGWTGNRGILDGGKRRRGWATRAWLTCALDYFPVEGTDVRYTRLFFLDDASAFAAGHRPCARCRRADFNKYREAVVDGLGLTARPSAKDLDARLHAARVSPNGAQHASRHRLSDLPVGTFVKTADSAVLIARAGLFAWAPDGYRDVGAITRAETTVEVLTPAPTLAAFRAGYVPQMALPQRPTTPPQKHRRYPRPSCSPAPIRPLPCSVVLEIDKSCRSSSSTRPSV